MLTCLTPEEREQLVEKSRYEAMVGLMEQKARAYDLLLVAVCQSQDKEAILRCVTELAAHPRNVTPCDTHAD